MTRSGGLKGPLVGSPLKTVFAAVSLTTTVVMAPAALK